VFGIAFCGALACAQIPVGDVQITGNQRIEGSKIVAFTGLKPGKTTNNAQLQHICQKLVDSGFFTSANFTYKPEKSGAGSPYQIGFAVVEDPTLIPAVVDVEGMDPEAIWQQLSAVNPLIGPVMPDNDPAQTMYQKALDSVFSKPGHEFRAETKREAGDILRAVTMIVVFRDANAPKLTALEFEGNHGIDTETLEQALHGIVIGEPYSERELSAVVRLNLPRLYDRKGYLHAAFPKVTRVNPGAPEAIARISIDEGPCFKLGAVHLAGDDLPETAMLKAAAFHPGKPVNWDEVTVGAEMARRVLTSSGYLKAKCETQRVFRSDNATMDLQVAVNKGPQFRLGDLLFDGLDPDHQDLISRRFEIRSGAPVDDQYVFNFQGQVRILAGRPVKRIDLHYLPHAGGSNVLDVKYEIH
jgi:hypothetical protein